MDPKGIAVLVTATGGAIAGIIGAVFGGYALLYAAKAKANAAQAVTAAWSWHRDIDRKDSQT
jgi:hypothetical protein